MVMMIVMVIHAMIHVASSADPTSIATPATILVRIRLATHMVVVRVEHATRTTIFFVHLGSLAFTDLPIDHVHLLLQLLFLLLHLFQLFLNDETMISLKDLLVDELAPSLGIELIVEVELVALRRVLMPLLHADLAQPLLHLLDIVVNLRLYGAATLPVFNYGPICVKAHLSLVELEADSFLSATIQVLALCHFLFHQHQLFIFHA